MFLLHFDADAFFASVEQAADNRLRGRPVAVGGLHRGIVASASYEARQYGVRTPMPMSQARRLCPKLIVLPVRFELYEQFSENIFGMAEEITPIVEKQGIDEGYLDLTGTPACRKREPAEVADKFGRDVRDWLKVTISRGVARTKLISQIASKLNKPNGLTVIPPDESTELSFLQPLAVKWLPGIGEVGARLFESAGILRIGQVAEMPLDWLTELVGSAAHQIRDFARNIDPRPVELTRPDAFSYGHQETFPEDKTNPNQVLAALCRLADEAFLRLRADGKQARTVTVKIRYTDMDEHQGQMSLPEPTDVEMQVYPLLSKLLDRLWDRRVRIRMVQVKLSNIYSGFSQMDLFGAKQKQRNLAIACQAIRERFGTKAMMRKHDWEAVSDQHSAVSKDMLTAGCLAGLE
ncbi:MAG TPA: DNA polymerase IV [Phycisphaerae bacterium]|nr:DNA polymerase IV [Phycisphaerae bacterium]HRR84862.1 DNA polymerase IV [Phycisphaerae bacterium]